ncbi:MAG TPA: ATP/GTP-binding protein [Nitrososphaeraceae archaeon]|nr:ATP/GTP-binding protein [Nitrososphaeraceae archaeon]
MDAVYITGTAGSGKSLLTSRLLQWYKDTKSFPITLNLDPGAVNLPYKPDVDVRDYIDMQNLMERYDLGPNGSLVMASDMIATRLDEIQNEVDSLNPDYVIVDTPGQIELFAFRASGPYFISNFQSDNRVTLFIFDGVLVSSPLNYVSMSLLSSSIKLRLKTSQVNVITKSDLINEKLKCILEWSTSNVALESALSDEKDAEFSLLSKDLLRAISKGGFMQSLVAISSVTMNGMVNLAATLSRILNLGEEAKD